MPRGVKSVVNKVTKTTPKSNEATNSRKEAETSDLSGNKQDRSRSRSNTRSKDAASPARKRMCKARRNLQEAIELDKRINTQPPAVSEAEKLMYAILPGNSHVLKNFQKVDDSKNEQRTKILSNKDQQIKEKVNITNSSNVKQVNNNSRADEIQLTKINNCSKLGEQQNESDEVLELSPFRMTVDPGEDDLSEVGEEETDSSNEGNMLTEEDEIEQLDFDDSQNQMSQNDQNDEVPRANIPILDFETFKDRPEVQDFMLKMYQATVEKKQPSLVQENARAINNIKLQINTGKDVKERENKGISVVKKSRSESTAYVPALKMQRLDKTIENPEYVSRATTPANNSPGQLEQRVRELINDVRISNFPEDKNRPAIPRRMAMEDPPQRGSAVLQPPSGPSKVEVQSNNLQQQETARKIAERAIVEAERFKASVHAPTGMLITPDSELSVPAVDHSFSDDNVKNFCQVTNHVDSSNEVKIAKGGFVEMTKIAPPKFLKLEDGERKIELCSKEGKSFWLPFSDKEPSKIVNFRQWEQAFKVYAAIYTRYNPHRGAEIYQYVHSIGLAASAYQWDNVAYYDHHFRKLMSENPQRSWGKVNTQLWSLSMRDPITYKTNSANSHSNNSHANTGTPGNPPKKTSNNEWKDICCWRWNKNRCNKRASECRFHHKCSHCGSSNHIYLACSRKRKNGDNQNVQTTKESGGKN